MQHYDENICDVFSAVDISEKISSLSINVHDYWYVHTSSGGFAMYVQEIVDCDDCDIFIATKNFISGIKINIHDYITLEEEQC